MLLSLMWCASYQTGDVKRPGRQAGGHTNQSQLAARGAHMCRHLVPLWQVPRNLMHITQVSTRLLPLHSYQAYSPPCGECPEIWCYITQVSTKPLPLHGYQAFSPPVVSAQKSDATSPRLAWSHCLCTVTRHSVPLWWVHGILTQSSRLAQSCCLCTVTRHSVPPVVSEQKPAQHQQGRHKAAAFAHEQALSPPVRNVLNTHARSPRSAHGRCLYSYSHISDCSLPLCHFCPCRQGHCQSLSLCQSCAQDFYQYHLFRWLWRQRHTHILCTLTPGSIHPRFPQPCSCCARFVSNQIALPRSRAQPRYFPSPSDGHQSGMWKRWGSWHPRQGYLVTKIRLPSSRVVPNSTPQVKICQN